MVTEWYRIAENKVSLLAQTKSNDEEKKGQEEKIKK